MKEEDAEILQLKQTFVSKNKPPENAVSPDVIEFEEL
jgi:hypothetical protein